MSTSSQATSPPPGLPGAVSAFCYLVADKAITYRVELSQLVAWKNLSAHTDGAIAAHAARSPTGALRSFRTHAFGQLRTPPFASLLG